MLHSIHAEHCYCGQKIRLVYKRAQEADLACGEYLQVLADYGYIRTTLVTRR